MSAGALAAALATGRLDHVALAIATLDDEPADAAATVAALDGWGADVARRGGGSLYAGIDALEGLLARRLGFAGDRATYDDPRNSFLPQVVARRRGLPIALAVVYLEVARRAALPLVGLALPGHFVVAYRPGPGGLVAIDPFDHARILTAGDLDAIAARAGTTLSPAMLAPATPREIAARMLRNLAGSYQRRGRADKLAEVAALAAAVDQAGPATWN